MRFQALLAAFAVVAAVSAHVDEARTAEWKRIDQPRTSEWKRVEEARTSEWKRMKSAVRDGQPHVARAIPPVREFVTLWWPRYSSLSLIQQARAGNPDCDGVVDR